MYMYTRHVAHICLHLVVFEGCRSYNLWVQIIFLLQLSAMLLLCTKTIFTNAVVQQRDNEHLSGIMRACSVVCDWMHQLHISGRVVQTGILMRSVTLPVFQ